MLKQRIESNKNLEFRKSTKSILPIQGRLFVDCLVQSIKHRKLFTTRESGNSSGNMNYFDNHYMNALENAIHKHYSKGGVSGAVVIKVFNYRIKYFNDDVKIKRVIKREYKIIQVPTSSRIQKVTKKINVKGYIRKSGIKVKGYIRKKYKYKEIIVKGYQYKKPLGKKGKYVNNVYFKGNKVLSSNYKIKSTKYLNKELGFINEAKNKALFVDRI